MRHVRVSRAARDGKTDRVTPEDAGWARSGLRVLRLDDHEPVSIATGVEELFVLPLSGGVEVTVAAASAPALVEATFTLDGRTSVFTRVTDFAYVGRDSQLTIRARGSAEVALPSARCDVRLPPRYGRADDVPVEIRGAGAATRQVTNFGVPGAWDHADRLICCELITPPGNWSSYPPHKHDSTAPCGVEVEEIYYYRVAGEDQQTPSLDGFGYHRTYTGVEHVAAGLAPIDDLFEVRDGDVVLVPYGFHGPSIAAPGYPLYYLNVMAGPGPRALAPCDDPGHAWVRGCWVEEGADPRCPMTSAAGRVTEAGMKGTP